MEAIKLGLVLSHDYAICIYLSVAYHNTTTLPTTMN